MTTDELRECEESVEAMEIASGSGGAREVEGRGRLGGMI